MKSKQEMVSRLREEFDRWEALLARLSEEQIVAPILPDGLSIKDGMAHLWGWQQISVARMEAALHDWEPIYPEWPEGLEPESEEGPDRVNAWFYEANRDRPWAEVYHDWRTNFSRFLELAEAVPEADLMDAKRYPWLDGYTLLAVLEGSYEHHHVDHYETLVEWLREHG